MQCSRRICVFCFVAVVAMVGHASAQSEDVTRLAHPDVAERLSLEDPQRAAIQQLLMTRAEAIAKAGNNAEKQTVSSEFRKQIIAVLNDQQRQLWTSLKPESRLRFQFREMKWDDVLAWFANQEGLTLVMDRVPEGTFTYSDARTYTPSEGIDLLNSVLMTRNYTLVRREKMLVVMSLSDNIPLELLPRVPLEQLGQRGRFELVSVLFPLAGRPIDAVLQEVKPYLSSYGRAVPLAQSSQLLVVETAGKMQTINELIASVPLPKPAAPPKPAEAPKPVFAAYPLGTLDANKTLETIKKLVPSEQVTADPKSGVLSAFVIPDQQTAIKQAIDQMLASNTNLETSNATAYQYSGITPEEIKKQILALAPNATVAASPSRVLVIAGLEDAQRVRESLAAIDVQPVTGETTLKVFPLETLAAAPIEAAIRGLLPKSQVAANTESSSLIVRGSPEDIRVATEVMDIWQRGKANQSLQFRTFPLERQADATWIATIKRVLPEANLWLTAEGRQLAVLASAPQLATIESLLPSLLSALPNAALRTMRIYPLSKNQQLRRASLSELPVGMADVKIVDSNKNQELLVWASEQQHEAFAELLKSLDQAAPRGPSTVPKTYPLALQDASTAVQLLTAEFPEAKFSLDADNTHVIVIADSDLHNAIAPRIAAFNDQLPAREVTKLETYAVRGMAASTLQQTLTPLLTKARVNLDTERNRLLITADNKTHQAIQELVQALSQAAGVDQQKVVVAYALKHSVASQVKPVLDQLAAGAQILADDKLKQIVVTANIDTQAMVKGALDQIDREPSRRPAVEIRSFDAKKLQAATLITSLQKLWPDLQLSADTTANRVIASGAVDELDALGVALEKLIAAPDGKPQVVKSYPLPAGDIVTLPNILGQIAPQAIISADAISRTVTVWANEEQQDRVQQALEQISKTAHGAKSPATYMVHPSQVLAAQTAIQALFPATAVATVPTTGQLIVVATHDQQQHISRVVELLAGGPQAAERTVKVLQVDPQRIPLSSMLSAMQSTLPTQIRIESNPLNNTLLIVGTEAEIQLASQRFETLRQQLPEPTANTTVVYPLQHASPTSVMTLLQSLLPRATIVQDPLSKSVAATARAEDHQRIAEFLKAFDIPKKSNLETQVYRLKRASGRGLQVVLDELIPEAVIYGSREEGVLIVTATAEQHQRIAAVVRDFENQYSTLTTQVFSVGKGTASTLVQALQNSVPRATLAADNASGSLIVTATEEDLKRVETIVKQLVHGNDGDRPTEFYSLASSEPQALARALEQSFPTVNFVSDATSGGLFVTATNAEHKAIAKVIADLNSKPGNLPSLKAFALKHADPEVVAKALTEAFGRRSAAGVSFSRDTQSVFVVANKNELNVAQQLIEQIDTPEINGAARSLRQFSLAGADGKTLATSLQNLFKESANPVEVSYDNQSDQILVVGDASQMRLVEESMKQFSPPKRQLEILQLNNADPYAFKLAAESLFEDEPANAQPSISVDNNQQQVLIRATVDQLAEIHKLLTKMGESAASIDSATGGSGRLRFVPVHRKSEKLLQELQELWPRMGDNPLKVLDPRREIPDQPPAAPAVNRPATEDQSAVEPATESEYKIESAMLTGFHSAKSQVADEAKSPIVVVVGETQWTLASEDTAALEQFRRLLDSLLNPVVRPFASAGNYSVYLLRHADASELQELLTELFRPNDSLRRAGLGEVMQRVKIVADTRINGLVVSGSRADRSVVEELLGVFDSEDLIDTLQQISPTVVTLRNTSAKSVSMIIESIYKSQLSAGAGRRPLAIPEGVSTEVATMLQQINAQSSSPLLTVAVDDTNNALILRGPPDLTAEVKSFIEGLDQQASEQPGKRIQLLRLESTNTKNLEKAIRVLMSK